MMRNVGVGGEFAALVGDGILCFGALNVDGGCDVDVGGLLDRVLIIYALFLVQCQSIVDDDWIRTARGFFPNFERVVYASPFSTKNCHRPKRI